MKNEAIEVLMNRRSVRKFKPEQITDAELKTVLEKLGVPPEVVPLILLRPFSGGAAVALRAFRRHGDGQRLGAPSPSRSRRTPANRRGSEGLRPLEGEGQARSARRFRQQPP